MFDTHNLSAFLVSSFLIWITPGSDTMYILARSISQGAQAGVVSVLGISSGILVHTLFAALGLSAILATSALAFTTLKMAGAFYLIYLGFQALLSKTPALDIPEVDAKSRWHIYRQGVITNILNPEIALFFLAFLPQFVNPKADLGAAPFLLLGILFAIGGTIWCLMLAGSAAIATNTIKENRQVSTWGKRISGGVYIGLGLHLLRSKFQSQ